MSPLSPSQVALSTERSAEIVADPRLTAEAVRLVLHVALRGPGEHEIGAETLCILLGCRGDKPVRAAIRRAVECGYLHWRPGGRGHANRYTYLAPQGSTKADRAPAGAGNPDSSPPAASHEAPAPTRVEAAEAEDTPSILSPTLDLRATVVIERMNGCRGALTDYLAARVPPERHYAYVQTLASWLANPNCCFATAGGGLLPEGDRHRFLALALNELGASDETPYRAPPGDPRNLKTKLSVLIREASRGPPPSVTGRSGRSRLASPATAEQEHSTAVFRGFKR